MKQLILFFFLLCAPLYVEAKQTKQIPTQAELVQWEEKLLHLINAQRKEHNLPSLKNCDILSHYAKEHSQNMSDKKVEFGHDGFHDRANAIKKKKKIRSVAENVAYNYNYPKPLEKAVEGWMNSPGHRKNILGDFDESGIGIVFSSEGKCYLTQMFSKHR